MKMKRILYQVVFFDDLNPSFRTRSKLFKSYDQAETYAQETAGETPYNIQLIFDKKRERKKT